MQKYFLKTRTELGVVQLTINPKGQYVVRNVDKKLIGRAWIDPTHNLWVNSKGKKGYTTLRGAVIALQRLGA